MQEPLEDAIGECLRGRKEAFRHVVDACQERVFRVVAALIPNAQEREDVAQEIFMACFQGLTSYRPERGSFASWLAAIARNRCLNWLRDRRPDVLASGPETGEPVEDRSQADLEWDECLDAALARLPAEQRTAFVLAEIDGMTYEEVTRVEGVGLGTVKSRIHRARERLRKELLGFAPCLGVRSPGEPET